MVSWPKRVVVLVAGVSLVGCATGDRGFLWRGAQARPRVRANCMPPAAPEYVPAGIQRPSALPVTPTEPTPIPQNATPPAPEPTIAPEAPLEPTSAAVPGRQFFAPPLPPEDPSTNWDLAPLEEESVFELPPHPRRASDRPTSNRKEERSAVEELGDGPIARHHRLMERPAKVARSDPRGHTSAPVETQLVVRSNSPK